MDLEQTRKKFEKNWNAGTCSHLMKMGQINNLDECIVQSQDTAKNLSEKWIKGYSKGMKNFLGLKENFPKK